MAEIKTVCEKTFRTMVEDSACPVLVDFYADWCGPCKMLHPELEKLAAEAEDFVVAQVNVDENNHLAERFNVSNIPCMILFKNGEPADVIVGYRTVKQLRSLLKKEN